MVICIAKSCSFDFNSFKLFSMDIVIRLIKLSSIKHRSQRQISSLTQNVRIYQIIRLNIDFQLLGVMVTQVLSCL